MALERAGIDPAKVYFTNAMRCLPTESPPGKAGINACSERLAEEVLAYPRTVILALGNSAGRSFLQNHSFKITGKRGQPIDLEEIGVFLPTFHPASILRNQGEYPRWMEDIKYAAKIYDEGAAGLKKPPKPTAHIMLTSDEAVSWDSRVRDGTQLADWPTRKTYGGIHAAVRAVKELRSKSLLAADIETGYSYSPRLGTVLALSIAWSPTQAIVFSEGLLSLDNPEGRVFRKYLLELLTDQHPRWVGHNFKYDGSYLRWQLMRGKWPESGAFVNYDDTMLEHYVLDETKGTHDLESVARDLLGATDYKHIVKKYTKKANKAKGIEADLGYENVPREILYPYAALDTTHTFSIHRLLNPKIKKSKSLTRLYEKLLLPASIFLQKVQDHGLWVNQDYVNLLDRELGAKVKKAEADLLREVNRETWLFPINQSHEQNEETGPTDFGPVWDTEVYMKSAWRTKKRPDRYLARNWRHTSFILERLIGWVPMNTNERTLRDLDQTGKDQSATFGYKAKNYARGHPNRKVQLNYPFIQALIDYRLASHAYNMMVNGTKKNMEPDGRLHTTFQLQATETGRLSSTGPNLQNLPVPEKDDPMPYRNIVGSPPGYNLIEADYSQVELRLLAHFSDDEALLDVYRTGRDLHTELSIAIWGDRTFDPVSGVQTGGYTNYQRVRAKAVNFGIAYGRGAGSIAAEHDIPEEEAEEMRQAWFRQFPKAAEWLRYLHESPLRGRTVVTPFGRRRRFGVVSRDNYHELKNQSANFPMQGTGTDLTLFSAMRVQERWERSGLDARVVCLVHDAIVVEASEAASQQASDELTAMMMDTPRRILQPKIDFTVDTHIGKMWGSMKTEEMASTKTTKEGVTDTFGKAGVASGKL